MSLLAVCGQPEASVAAPPPPPPARDAPAAVAAAPTTQAVPTATLAPTPAATSAPSLRVTPTPNPVPPATLTPVATGTPRPTATPASASAATVTPPPTTTPTPAATVAPPPTPAAIREIRVDTVGIAFNPKDVQVTPGERVRFVVNDVSGLLHTFTIAATQAKSTTFVDSSLAPNGSQTVDVTSPEYAGQLYLVCRIHEAGGMTGAVHVGPLTPSGPAAPAASFGY